MPRLAAPGHNPEIDARDVAASLTKAWVKAKGERDADVRAHVVLCREQGDEAGAQAFLPLGGEAWWVPLYAAPSPATAAPILAAENDDERADRSRYSFERGWSLSRLLDVARLVPGSREAALDRFVARAEALIADVEREHEDDDEGSAFERLAVPYGSLARESLDHARALVDAHSKLLMTNGGLVRRPRWGATSYVAELLRTDFDAALACAPVLQDSEVYELPQDVYGLELTATQWVSFARAATNAASEYGVDWLLGALASGLRSSWRERAAELALGVYAACEEADTDQLDLLIELGRHDEARALLATFEGHETDPETLSAQRFALGLDPLAETIDRMARGVVRGAKYDEQIDYSRGMQLQGLQRVTELVLTHTPDDASGLAELTERRSKLARGGPQSQYDRGMWGRFEARERLFRLRELGPEAAGYAAELAGLVASVKSNAADRRRFVAGEIAYALAEFDPLGAVTIAKIKSPQTRCESALALSRAYLPLDPGGALSVLCSLCPKQPHRPSELLDGTADVLRAIYL